MSYTGGPDVGGVEFRKTSPSAPLGSFIAIQRPIVFCSDGQVQEVAQTRAQSVEPERFLNKDGARCIENGGL